MVRVKKWLTAMLIEADAAPLGLLSCTVCTLDAVLAGTLPKETLEGLTASVCATVLLPVLPISITVLVPPGALLGMVSVPVVMPAVAALKVTSTRQKPV